MSREIAETTGCALKSRLDGDLRAGE